MKIPSLILSQVSQNLKFVPASKPALSASIEQLQEFMDMSSKVCVMTGAGISTESGVPDYRSKDVGLYARSNHKPIQYQEFVKQKHRRRQYWARNYAGWSEYSKTQPNVAHRILAEWEKKGKISCLVTQNVDYLHAKAGSKNLIELHGSAYRTHCLSCDFMTSRFEMQKMFDSVNKNWSVEDAEVAPDADTVLTQEQIKGFTVPECPKCGGDLKPDMVFFGDNVPKDRVERVYREIEQADSFFVIGSSLYVYSGFRFVKHALEFQKPIAILNIGETRADKNPDIYLRIDARIGEVLPQIEV